MPIPDVNQLKTFIDYLKQPTPDLSFGEWLMSNSELQWAAYGFDPKNSIKDGELTQEGKNFVTEMMFAAMIEIGEMANEFGWKSWATSRHVNREQAIVEAVDAMHFLANMLRVIGCTGEELTQAYRKKQIKNAQRQLDGYDGVTDKCAYCGRDLSELPKTGAQYQVAYTQFTKKVWDSNSTEPAVLYKFCNQAHYEIWKDNR